MQAQLSPCLEELQPCLIFVLTFFNELTIFTGFVTEEFTENLNGTLLEPKMLSLVEDVIAKFSELFPNFVRANCITLLLENNLEDTDIPDLTIPSWIIFVAIFLPDAPSKPRR